jgi:hypothetical protein
LLAPLAEDEPLDEIMKRRADRRRHDQPVSASRTEGRGAGREHG